jgi:hypothetical protein
MTRRGWRTWLAALPVAVGLLGATARAEQENLLAEARRLAAEAKPLVRVANDVDLAMEQRRGPRKEAFAKLKQARALFEQYFDLPANKGLEESDAFQKEYCEIGSDIYWLKKESALGELEKEKEVELPPAATSSGGEGGKTPPATDGAGAAPAGPPKSETPSEFAWRAKSQFEAIAAYQKAHPGDVAILKQFFEKFLAEFSDPSLPEYAAVVKKLGEVNDRLTTVLKTVANRDPDSFKPDAGGAEKSIFGRLSQDFSAKDPDVRRRAATLMAQSRARSATYFLSRGLTDKDAELARICRDGLVAIGGSSTGDNLVKLYRDAAKEKQAAAMDVFTEVTKKGPVDAAAQSGWIGHYVLSQEPEIAERAIELLTQMGKAGGPGLMYGLDSKFVGKQIVAIERLAQVRHYKAATIIGDRFLAGSVPPALREAALKGIETMGVYAFPYLIPVMSNPWVPFVMNKLAGEPMFIRGDQKKARAWWNAHKPADAEDS